MTDRLALVRSMSHKHNNHSNLYTLSGYPALDFTSETNALDSRHHPFFGSVIDYLEDRRSRGQVPQMPRNIGLPFQFSTHSQFFRRAGPYGAFLGSGYNPVWTEFEGQATQSVKRVSFFDGLKDVEVQDPYLGITPESRLRFSASARMHPTLTLDRLNRRRSLVQQLDEARGELDQTLAAKSLDRFTSMAYSLLTSEKLVRALDVGHEPTSVREQYGMNALRPIDAHRTAPVGSRLPAGFRLLGRVQDRQHGVGHALRPLHAAWERSCCRLSMPQ